jgi:hypothetical protein
MAHFDRDAFIAAARAAAKPRLVGVNLPGVGSCWVRPLTAGDWIDAQTAISKLQADGVEITPRLRMAIGLAQNLCDDVGHALFDLSSMDDLNTLAALPIDAVAQAISKVSDIGTEPVEASDPNA